MTYQTAITKKGQLTIPKEFRDRLGLSKIRKVTVELAKNGRSLTVSPAEDFLAVARIINIKKGTNPLAVRDLLEQNYERP